MRRYLVTGAAGFIGSAIAKKLLDEGNEVWTIDNLSTGCKENIPEGIKFIYGNCQDSETIEQLNGIGFKAILHFAGQSSGEISFDDPVYDLRTNTESTLRLIEYGLRHGCNRFIYASSMSVYGDVPDRPINEGYPTRPLSFYGVGKLASEHYLRIYQAKGIEFTALRLFNVYGPNQNMKNLRQGMVSIFLAQLIKNNEVIVKGSPDRFRDFIYIKDVVNLVTRILNNSRSYGKVYNVGTGRRTTVKEVLGKLIKIGGINKKVVFVEGTPGDQRGIYADTSLIKDEFDFQCEYDLDKGLREMFQWAIGLTW